MKVRGAEHLSQSQIGDRSGRTSPTVPARFIVNMSTDLSKNNRITPGAHELIHRVKLERYGSEHGQLSNIVEELAREDASDE